MYGNEKLYLWIHVCAPSADSDQLAHQHGLISSFAECFTECCLGYPSIQDFFRAQLFKTNDVIS